MLGSRGAGSVIIPPLLALLAACSQEPVVDWEAKENFFVKEKSERTDEGVRLEYHSLVDAPAAAVYRALADVEHYADFVDGVTESTLLSTDLNTKTILITETVIGRQTRARVKWWMYPNRGKVEFQTLESDSNYNDGSYTVYASPDGKRSYVVSIFHVKEKGAPQHVPIGVLAGAMRESFETAARSVKRRALAPTG